MMRLRLSMVRGVVGVVLGAAIALSGARAAAGAAHPMRVENGVLTVDGLTVRTGMALHIADLHYLYIGLPGAGTAVIADRPFAGAVEERGAFRGNSLTVVAGTSRVQLTAVNRLRGSHAAYVRFDSGSGPGSGRPEMAFGDAAFAPASWSGALPQDRVPVRRVKVRGRRALRTAKLCRPSRKGREMCATIREVVYRPTPPQVTAPRE